MSVSASEHFEGERLTVNINIRQNFGDGVLGEVEKIALLLCQGEEFTTC